MTLLSNFYWKYKNLVKTLPSFVSAGTFSAQGNQSNNVTIAILDLPPNLVVGNLLIAFVDMYMSVSPLNPPIYSAGINTGNAWSLIEAVNNTINGGVGLVLFKYVTANEPASYQFSLDSLTAGTNRGIGQIFQFKDANWSPENYGAFFNSGNTVTGGALAAPAYTQEIFLGYSASGSNLMSVPSGMTQIASSSLTTPTGLSLVASTLDNTNSTAIAAQSATTADNLNVGGGQAHNFLLSTVPTYQREAIIPLSIYASMGQSSSFNVPSGALICITVLFRTQTGDPVVSDSAGNVYATTGHYTDPNGVMDHQSFYVLASVAAINNVVSITGMANLYFTATVMCYSKPAGLWSVDTTYAVTSNYQAYVTGLMTTQAGSLIIGGVAEAYTGTDSYFYTYPVLPIAHDFNTSSSGVSCLEYLSPQANTYTIFDTDAYVGLGYGGIVGINLISFQ